MKPNRIRLRWEPSTSSSYQCYRCRTINGCPSDRGYIWRRLCSRSVFAGAGWGLEAEKTKILVIGGTGVVGSYIVEHLVRRCERPFVSEFEAGRAGRRVDSRRHDGTGHAEPSGSHNALLYGGCRVACEHPAQRFARR